MSLTSAIFLIAFVSALTASLVRHPAYGLYTYIAIFYLHPPDRWWGASLPDLRWSLLAGFVTLLSLWRLEPIPERPNWLQNSAVGFLLAFLAWFWIQLPWVLAPDLHTEAAILFTKYLLLVYLFYAIVRSEDIFRNVLLVHVLGCFYLGWIVYTAQDSGRIDSRFDGVGGPGIDDANSLAMQLTTGLLAAAALVLSGSTYVRIIALVAAPFLVNAIIQTMSRGPVVGLIAGGLVMLWVTPARFRRAFYVLGVLGLLILLRMAPATFWERIGTITAPVSKVEEVDMSTRTRLELVGAQVRMFLDHPFGSGHRGTAVLSPRYLGQEHMAKSEGAEEAGLRSSHNTFLSILVEQGLIGSLLFCGLLLAAFSQIRKLKALDAQGLPEALGTYRAAIAGGLASVLVAGLFADYLKAEVFIWFIALLTALNEMAPRALRAAAPDNPRETAAEPASGRRSPRPRQRPGVPTAPAPRRRH